MLGKEGLQWKVNLPRTQEEAAKAAVAALRKMLPPAVQKLFENALSKGSSKGGAPPQ